ncbi:hypothetical protein [Pseudomonas aeruginosa]|uniref:hypothetical protein n=1 Tax=Pseudomonas aeruginosa TaxID=287 RepID=UPI000FF46130|nr:hypothetical protein [Pseudomonas aeruginosa]RPO27948.1 hypothetical protein IPC1225_33640 [Pseudomonas aeruginosa]
MQETDETLDELPPLEARYEIREVSRGTACVALLAGLVAGATGLWLASLPNAWRFARPEARAVAGGKRVKLALCGAALNGQKMELEPLARLIYRYILAGHRQRALQHHRAPGSDGSGA